MGIPRYQTNDYQGRANFKVFLQALDRVEWGTVSPSAAAKLLGVSAARIFQLMEKGQVRSWRYIEEYTERATYIEISLYDLVRYGMSTGRIVTESDLGLRFPGEERLLKVLRDCDTMEAVKA